MLANKSIFRENAIKALNSFEEIPDCFIVSGPQAWLFLITSLLALLGLSTWGIFGTWPASITAPGIILASEQIQRTESIIAENFQEQSKKVAELKTLLELKQVLYLKHYLTLSELAAAREAYLNARTVLFSDQPAQYSSPANNVFVSANGELQPNLSALVFLSADDASKLKEGMKVLVLPQASSAYQYGYIQAKILALSQYPATKAMMFSYLGNMNSVDDFFLQGLIFIAKIQLLKNPQTPSGLAWTAQPGSPFKLKQGSPIIAKIIKQELSPLRTLLSMLRMGQ